jgi:hypothetical protein
MVTAFSPTSTTNGTGEGSSETGVLIVSDCVCRYRLKKYSSMFWGERTTDESPIAIEAAVPLFSALEKAQTPAPKITTMAEIATRNMIKRKIVLITTIATNIHHKPAAAKITGDFP